MIEKIKKTMQELETFSERLNNPIKTGDYFIEDLGCPHKFSKLKNGHGAVYLFFYKGIDTTHKFIKVNVYDVIMSIETLGAIRDQVIANADAIKPINIILINLNYQG